MPRPAWRRIRLMRPFDNDRTVAWTAELDTLEDVGYLTPDKVAELWREARDDGGEKAAAPVRCHNPAETRRIPPNPAGWPIRRGAAWCAG
jgi:hypothetical protein